jgi:mannose-6-phosphate isomerase
MHLIVGALKEYDWGPIDGLARWYGATTGRPQAELWFGAHPSGPSLVLGTDEHLADVASTADVPVLVKLLAAAQPLSIQVHPTADIARTQWQAQLDGAEQVYSDTEEKAELLIALEPFEAFAGWRDVEQVTAMLTAIDGTAPASSALQSGDIAGAITALLDLGKHGDVDQLTSRLPEAAAAAGLSEPSRSIYRSVATHFPHDPGAILTCLLDDLHLQPGQSVFVPAGVPHSYVRGLALEVMTSSDNVVRLGLTSKPVFVEHALAALVFDAVPTLRPETGGVIDTPAGFDVQFVQDASRTLTSGRYRLVLAIDDVVHITSGNEQVSARPGQAVAVLADEPDTLVDVPGFAAVVQA